MQKISTFVTNRLKIVDDLSRKFPITLNHISGTANVADYVTKPCSYKLLSKTEYFEGPAFLCNQSVNPGRDFSVDLPNPMARDSEEIVLDGTQSEIVSKSCVESKSEGTIGPVQIFPIDRFSDLRKVINVTKLVLKFVNALKKRLAKKGRPFIVSGDSNLNRTALSKLIETEQKICYPEIFEYFESGKEYIKNLPSLITQLNLFLDSNGILRVKAKFDSPSLMPILLPKESKLTDLIIRFNHESLGHVGVYQVLKELRKSYWITHYFSAVRKVLKRCIVCKKFNESPIKLNQNAYRDFRVSPNKQPFSSVFLDYIGPFSVKLEGTRTKVWLLIFTCLWTRGINLKICRSADVKDMLRAVQLHIYEFGMFRFCVSDLGTQLQAGANVLSKFLKDEDTISYFEEFGIQQIQFHQYPKGNSSLGSLVEACVKQVKHLLFKSIRNIILDYFDFELMVQKALHLVNKRPVAFKDGLRDLKPDETPDAITPEMLMRGYETCTLNVIPQLHGEDLEDPDFSMEDSTSAVKSRYDNLRTVKSRISESYNSEFLATLMKQAIDKPNRYTQTPHRPLKVGDVVLLVEKNTKRYNYPMGRVVQVVTNSLGETTAAYVVKGVNREKVYRHSSSLILLIPCESVSSNTETQSSSVENSDKESIPYKRKQPSRRAASVCKERLKQSEEDC